MDDAVKLLERYYVYIQIRLRKLETSWFGQSPSKDRKMKASIDKALKIIYATKKK